MLFRFLRQMVILRQEELFKYNSKGKFVECLLILTHELDGPILSIYKDESAKKLLENRLAVNLLAEQIRFGTTTTSLQNIQPDGFLPHIKASDARIHNSCFIAIRTERLVRKVRKPYFVWLCAKSTEQLFQIIQVISACLVSMQVPAPIPSQSEDINALHRYRPKPFEPKNDWEAYWDNPPKVLAEPLISMDLMRSSGVAMSVDALNVMEDVRRNSIKPEKRTNGKSIYSSTPALDNSTIYTNPSLKRGGETSSRSSTISRISNASSRRVSNRVIEEAMTPIYELKRQRELAERQQKGSVKSRLYEPKSSTPSETISSAGKSRNKKAQRYTSSRRGSIMSNGGFESDTHIMAYANPLPSRPLINILPIEQTYGQPPASILKTSNKPEKHRGKKSSVSSMSSTCSERSSSKARHKNRKSSAQSSGSSFSSEKGGRFDNSEPNYTDAEVQTDNEYHSTVPLIAIGSYPANHNHHYNNSPDFQAQIDKLREISNQSSPSPNNNHLAVKEYPSSLTPPSPPIRKNTPVPASNAIALAAAAAAAAAKNNPVPSELQSNEQQQIGKQISSFTDDSLSSDFDDDEDPTTSGTITPQPDKEKTQTRFYRINVENGSEF